MIDKTGALSEELVALRGLLRLSQRGLATASGVSEGTIRDIEGGVTISKPSTLRRLATALAHDPLAERPSEDRIEAVYQRLMRAAGHIDDNIRVPVTDLVRSVDDLSDEEVADALTRYSNDPELSVAFLGIAQEWTDLEPSAQRFLLWSIEETRRIDAQAKAANQRGAPRSPRTRS